MKALAQVEERQYEVVVKAELWIRDGEVRARRPHPETDVRLSTGAALKLARRLGVEGEVRGVIEAQAREAIEKAAESRRRAAESYASSLRWANESDASAARTLERLGVVS